MSSRKLIVVIKLLRLLCLASSIFPVITYAQFFSIKNVAMETWLYGSKYSVKEDSILNPSNRIAYLPYNEYTSVAKLNLELLAPSSEITIRPYFIEKQSKNDFNQTRNFDAYLSQGFIRTRLGNNFSASVGRERMTWGPAYFRSPSNPYYFNASRTNPLSDLPGLDLIKLSYSNNNNNITTGYINGSDRATAPANFSRTALLKIDTQGADYIASLIASKTPQLSGFLGGFGQVQVRDELLIYGEFGYGNRTNGLSVTDTTISVTQPTEKKSLALIGTAFTTNSGQTMAVEYLNNGFGLPPAEYDRYFSIVEAQSSQFKTPVSPSMAGSSQATLATAITQSSSLLAKNYLFLLWQGNPADGTFYWRNTLAVNLKDQSMQLSVYGEKNIADKISLFGVISKNIGNVQTEYGALTSSTIVVGLKIFLF